MIDSHIKPSPSAMACRQLLANLTPATEKRKGYFTMFFLIAFVFFPIGSLSVFWGYGTNMDDIFENDTIRIIVFFILIFSCFFALFFFAIKEIALYGFNVYDKVVHEVTPLLEEGERFLTYSMVKSLSHLPSWMEGTKRISCIVFTSDRVILINLAIYDVAHLVRDSREGIPDVMIDSIYSADLLNPDHFKIHGFVSIFLMFGFKNLTITPLGEVEPCSWLLNHPYTRNGKLLKEINSRVKDYHKQQIKF